MLSFASVFAVLVYKKDCTIKDFRCSLGRGYVAHDYNIINNEFESMDLVVIDSSSHATH